MPDETLRCVPVSSKASKPPRGATATLARIRPAHLSGAKHRVENYENYQQGDGDHDHQAFLGALLAFVFAGPVYVVADWEFYAGFYLLHGFFYSAAQVAATDAVFNGDVSGIFFAVDFGGAVADVYRG